jgi:hypothetical protein
MAQFLAPNTETLKPYWISGSVLEEHISVQHQPLCRGYRMMARNGDDLKSNIQVSVMA